MSRRLIFKTVKAAVHILASTAGVLALNACTSLPTTESAAFRTIATSSQAGFSSLSDTEQAAVEADQLRRVALRQGRLLQDDGCAAPLVSADPCVLVFADNGVTDPAQGIRLVSHTERLERLVGAIGDYAGAMSDLAEAKDLDAQNAAVAKVGASVKALAAMAGPQAAIAGPAVDAIVFAQKQAALSERRRLMLGLAEAADPAVRGAAQALGAEAGILRTTLVLFSQGRFRTAEQALREEAATDPPAQRQALARAELDAAADLTKVRAIRTDFSSLAKAHEDLLKRLRDPSASGADAIAQAEAFIDVLQSFADLKPAKAKF